MEQATGINTPKEEIKEEEVSPEETETSKNEKIVENLFEEKNTYEQTTTTQRGELATIYNVYMGRIDQEEKTPYRSREIINKMRTEIAYIKPYIFSGKPEVEITGIGDEDKIVADILEKIGNYRLRTMSNIYDTLEDWVGQAVTFGTSVAKVCWKFLTQKNPDGTETPIADEPYVEVPNILDVFYNPIIPTISGQQSLIVRSVLNKEDVVNNPAYNVTNELGELNREKVSAKTTVSNIYDSQSQDTAEFTNVSKINTDMKRIEIYERITKDRIQTVADGVERLLLRDVPNPYGFINLVKFIYEKNTIPNRFDGIGAGHNVLGIDRLYYRMINQIMDNIKLINNSMFKFKKGAGIDTRQLVSKPGGGIACNDPEKDVIQLQTSDIKQSAFNVLQKLDDEHKRASGATDIFQGETQVRGAMVNQIAQTNAASRFDLIKRRFTEALGEVVYQLLKMDIENLQDLNADILKLWPEEERTMVFQIIKNVAPDVKFNVKINADTVVVPNKDIMVKQLIDWANMFSAMLPPETVLGVAKRILELRGVPNIKELGLDQALMNIQMQQQQNQMLQQMQIQTQGQPMQPGAMPPPGEQYSMKGINQGIQNSTYGH